MSLRKTSKKVDGKKFLNCKVLLDGSLQYTTFKGTNGSGVTLVQKHGYFTSGNVTVKESALNNTILRIHLLREDLHDLRRKYKSNSPKRRNLKDQKLSSFGRQLKRKSNFFAESLGLTPSRRGVVESRTVDNTRTSSSSTTEKSVRQMRNRTEQPNKTNSIINKFQLKHDSDRNITEKTILHKPIQKNYRDRIKIKLFPRVTTPTRRVNKNGMLGLASNKTLNMHKEILFVKNVPQWTYYLKFCPPRYPDEGKLNYSFQKLVTDVKHMKLPAPSWKIKVIIRQGKISAVTFTNKLSLERCVAFSANNDKYKITIDNKPALLLGSPKDIQTSEDLEILLDIIQNIDSDNPMIFYK